jgi:predicted transcriptional regulator
MRTTVDLDARLLDRARRLAVKEQRTVSAVLGDALAAYLASRKTAAGDPAFEPLVRGKRGGRFPTPAELAAIEEEEDAAGLPVPRRTRRRAAP